MAQFSDLTEVWSEGPLAHSRGNARVKVCGEAVRLNVPPYQRALS